MQTTMSMARSEYYSGRSMSESYTYADKYFFQNEYFNLLHFADIFISALTYAFCGIII